MNKKKILVCSESCKIPSGFGVYNKRLLDSLYRTGKYEIAEFATYGLIGDKERLNIPWKYYPNAVTKDHPKNNEYNSSPENQFGRWRFDRVLLDFRPDIVIDVRDYWMSYFEGLSPLRRNFKWFLMPTVDSFPQKEEWLDTYINADKIFTYSDWGRDILNYQTSNNINFADTVSPGIDLNQFKPLDNISEIKKALALDPNSIVIGTVMRNQKRKLYPELIRAFEQILEKLDPKIAEKTILYLHTAYPDAGWNLAELIKDSKVANHIYVTYVCRNCSIVFASLFGDLVQPCYKCGQKTCMTPNVSNGIDTDILVKIMNCFDIYVQYAICEGFGMPQVEAASCGVPVMTVNYSAMKDIISKLDAISIDVGSYFKELETSAIRVYPNQNDFIDKTVNLINMPTGIRKRIGYKTRELAEQHYDWNNIANKWMKHIDGCETTQHLWNSPFTQLIPKIEKDKLPNISNKLELMYYISKNYMERANISLHNYWFLKNITMSSRGFILAEHNEIKPYTIENFIDNINGMIDNYNIAEMARANPSILTKEDYIDYANGDMSAATN